MRWMLYCVLGGFLLGVAASGFFLPPAALPEMARGDVGLDGGEARNAERAHRDRLEARIAELEAALEEARRQSLGSEAAPSDDETSAATIASGEESGAEIDDLRELLQRGDAEGLVAAVLRLLRAGRYIELSDFLNGEVDFAANKRISAAFIAMALAHGPEVAAYAETICQNYGGVEGAAWPNLDALMVSLLPAFLLHHRDRFPQLEEAFVARLTTDLRSPESLPWPQALAAFDELGLLAPLDALAVLLRSPDKTDQANYRKLLRHLQAFGGLDGLDLLAGFVEDAADPSHWAVKLALHAIGRMDLAAAHAYLAARRRAGAEALRDASDFALASSSLEGLIDFLNSALPAARKAAAVRQVAVAEPEFLEELKRNADAFADPELRQMIERNGEEAKNTFASAVDGQVVRLWTTQMNQATSDYEAAVVNFSADGKLVELANGQSLNTTISVSHLLGNRLVDASGLWVAGNALNAVADVEVSASNAAEPPELTPEEALRRYEEARAALERLGLSAPER